MQPLRAGLGNPTGDNHKKLADIHRRAHGIATAVKQNQEDTVVPKEMVETSQAPTTSSLSRTEGFMEMMTTVRMMAPPTQLVGQVPAAAVEELEKLEALISAADE